MNLVEVIKEFKTDADCRSYLESLRWPDGVKCLRCASANVRKLTSDVREVFECKICEYQFTVTAGTIFHDSHLPLTQWFLVVALMCESKKGISANQIKRALGVQYRTAWHLCHRYPQSNGSWRPVHRQTWQGRCNRRSRRNLCRRKI